MKKNLPYINLLILALLLTTAESCSLLYGRKDNTPQLLPLQSLDLLLARASLTGTDYEHYTISKGKVFLECGNMLKNRFKPKDQNIQLLNSDNDKELRYQLEDLIDLTKDSESGWEEAGKLNNLTDPGKVALTVLLPKEKFEIVTSLDSVAATKSRKARKLKSLILQIRALSPEAPCGNKSFFGFSNLL